MKSPRLIRAVVIGAIAVLLCGIAYLRVRVSAKQESNTAQPPTVNEAITPKSRTAAPNGQVQAFVPTREITADHQPKREIHKDKDGRPILENVFTPEGVVKIHRTYRATDNTLLKEEAFLNGKPVPIPVLKP